MPHHHQDRPDLIGEHPFGDKGQLILLLLFLAVWVWDSFFLKLGSSIPCLIPLPFRIGISVLVGTGGTILAKVSHDIVFGEVRETPAVIRKGVFGIIRHPLYAAALLFYVTLIVATRSILAIIVFIGIAIFYHYIARHEEKMLLTRFGADYEAYMKEVPRWFPRMHARE